MKSLTKTQQTKTVHIRMVLSVALFFLTGCTFLHLREETKIIQYSTILVGNVSSAFSCNDLPIVVAAYTREKSKREIGHYTTLHQLGPYELIVPKGNYSIVAFADKNRNLCYDKGEAAGQYVGAEYVIAPAGGVVLDLDIVISEPETVSVDFPVGSPVAFDTSPKFHSTSPGAIADLDDPLFSEAFGNKGYWMPLEFFKEVGGNIYFLDAYDPAKIPILFVHGACGSPAGWKGFFEKIDRSRFQPWFYYYPSGASIESMSYLLYWKIYNLQIKYKFKELFITAHSMGGLVVRSFLTDFGNTLPFKTEFISISTPWGGDALAEKGVKYSPAVIPAWKDIQAEGDFIQSLYRKKMPPTVEHYLFFGYRGNRNPIRPNNDAVVTLSSLLDERSQAEAIRIYGFNEDHDSILSSEPVMAQYNALLNALYEKSAHTAQVPANMLQVEIAFDCPKELPRPRPVLLLRSRDNNHAETVLYLSQEDRKCEVGPFPSGNYVVSLVANGFAPDPVSMPIIIGDGAVPSVRFQMNPRKSLIGYIVNSSKKNYQAGVYRGPDEKVRVQSINLKGAGINRTLVPLKEDANYFDSYLAGADFAIKSSFCFYGLPAGEYVLTITAEGHRQYSTNCTVLPGQYSNERYIELLEEDITS
ncbi:MAG: alpha/beta hydrolase [Deltaproteobacteria bacterium]|nr:alpha/beta hydrolase [Deltaproteobacteria bacterium]